mgnify:CR=1 FL=1
MTLHTRTPKAPVTRKMVIDCRDMDSARFSENVVTWVMTFPDPSSMHVILPSFAPASRGTSEGRPSSPLDPSQMRRLQCTLQGLGCGVTRVTKVPLIRL